MISTILVNGSWFFLGMTVSALIWDHLWKKTLKDYEESTELWYRRCMHFFALYRYYFDEYSKLQFSEKTNEKTNEVVH